MRGYIGIGHSDDIESAVREATKGLKKADLLILYAPFSYAEKAADLLAEKYPHTPMIGTCGESIAKGSVLNKAITVIGFAGVEVATGLIEQVRTTPVQSMDTFQENIEKIDAGKDNTICLEFVTGSEERVISTVNTILGEAGIPLIGASCYGIPLGEKPLVILDGKVYHNSCAYAFIKNQAGAIRLYKENIYTRSSRRAHMATLVEPNTKTLFQLDGIPAVEIYQAETDTLMEDIVSGMPRHPLGRALGDDTCIIQTVSVDRNGVMFNGKAIHENDSIYIMKLLDYQQVHADLLNEMQEDSDHISFLLCFDSINRLRLFAEDGYLTEYAASMAQLAPSASLLGDGQQFRNQHMNQTLLCAAFE